MKKSIKILNSCLDYGDNYSQFTFEGAIIISKDELKLVDFEEMRNGFCEINIPEKKIDLSLVSEKQLIDELEKRICENKSKFENLKKFRLQQIFGD
jgi:hypothetical protein